MKQTRMWLTMAMAVWLIPQVSAAPAPAPVPTSQGPITEALRLRALLPRTAPLSASPAVMVGEGQIEMDRVNARYETRMVEEAVQTADGKTIKVTRVVTMAVPVIVKVRLEVKGCKFFIVSKDGKLETLDTEKATAALKKMTPVLTGESADVDPRTFDLIKPGTLCVIVQPQPPTPPPPLPDEKPRN